MAVCQLLPVATQGTATKRYSAQEKFYPLTAIQKQTSVKWLTRLINVSVKLKLPIISFLLYISIHRLLAKKLENPCISLQYVNTSVSVVTVSDITALEG